MLKHTKYISIFAVFLGFLLLPVFFALAQETTYSPLVNIPGLSTDSGAASIPDFVNAVYKIVIGLGALLGVIKIAIAGVKYSMSEVITDKSSAKNDIVGVLLGLAVLLIPWLVLNTIYPELTNLNFADGITNPGLSDVLGNSGIEEFICGNASDDIAQLNCKTACMASMENKYGENVTMGEPEIKTEDGLLICTVEYSQILGQIKVDGDQRIAEYYCTKEDEGDCLTECRSNIEKRDDFKDFESEPSVKDGVCHAVYITN